MIRVRVQSRLVDLPFASVGLVLVLALYTTLYLYGCLSIHVDWLIIETLHCCGSGFLPLELVRAQ